MRYFPISCLLLLILGFTETKPSIKKNQKLLEQNQKYLEEIINMIAPCDMVAWGTSYCDFHDCPVGKYGAAHVFTNEVDFRNATDTNYWLADNGNVGDRARLFLYLGGEKLVKGFHIKNTHNAYLNNDGTNNFTIFAGKTQSGPWSYLFEDFLKDARGVSPVPVEIFPLSSPITTQYVMFQIDSFYGGTEGGLQYFAVY